MKKKKSHNKNKSKAKIIKFPKPKPESISDDYDDNYIDQYEEFELWELFQKLHEKEDYSALVKHCKEMSKKLPNNQYAQGYLGEAFVLNGEYEKAIQFLSEHHKKHPYNMDYQHVILDALFALGKNEDDFEWAEKPIVLRMSKEILDACYEFLKPKRKPRTISDLYTEFISKGYLLYKARGGRSAVSV